MYVCTFDAFAIASFGTHTLTTTVMIKVALRLLIAYILEQERNELEETLASKAGGMLAGDAYAPETFTDTKEVAEHFTVRSSE